MVKFLKSIIKECLEDVLVKNPNLFNKTLSKENVNVIYVPCGKLPKSRADEYVKQLSDKFKECNPEYKILWIAFRNWWIVLYCFL